MRDSVDFWEAVADIRRRDGRFAEESYAFVMDALEFTVGRLPVRRHVSGHELLEGMCFYAKAQFGLMAWTVLKTWGISSTIDIGAIVFQLVDSGVLARREEDSIDDFDNAFDLRVVLEDDYFENVGPSSADRA